MILKTFFWKILKVQGGKNWVIIVASLYNFYGTKSYKKKKVLCCKLVNKR
jgi:hypothetical protein